MRYRPEVHHRRSIRLQTYDYAQRGAYFVTLCTYHRELMLEDPLVGRIVTNEWHKLARRFPGVHLDRFVVMPNHIHGIIWIIRTVGAQHSTQASRGSRRTTSLGGNDSSLRYHAAPLQPGVIRRGSLGVIVRAFKSVTTKRINRLLSIRNRPLWQRNYYERVIRNDDEFQCIRQYIIDNPAEWAEDKNNPINLHTT
jgi:REP element-mobilizing transposase RayT